MVLVLLVIVFLVFLVFLVLLVVVLLVVVLIDVVVVDDIFARRHFVVSEQLAEMRHVLRKRVEPEVVLHAGRNTRVRKHRVVLLHDVADLQALLRRERGRVNAVQSRHHALQLLPVPL